MPGMRAYSIRGFLQLPDAPVSSKGPRDAWVVVQGNEHGIFFPFFFNSSKFIELIASVVTSVHVKIIIIARVAAVVWLL